MEIEYLKNLIDVAKGERKASIVLKNAKLINVFTHEIEEDVDIAIYKKHIAGIGKYSGETEIDCENLYISYGFIDSHIHIESTMLTPYNFSKAVIPHGTIGVISDPHEIANVLGTEGIEFFIEDSKRTPLKFFFTIPSCVPATNMETSGAKLTAKEIEELSTRKELYGLSEMMNFPGVIYKDEEVLKKLLLFNDRLIDGHAPLLSGNPLNAYISPGIYSDHECTTKEEAYEKLKRGMFIMVREGTSEKNLEELIRIIDEKNYTRFLWATDDRYPTDLISEGHIDFNIKKAISLGLSPFIAISMATINPARYLGLKKMGAVAPGYLANITAFKDLNKLEIALTIIDGEIVFKDGEITKESLKEDISYKDINRFNLKLNTSLKVLPKDSRKIKVIKIIEGQILTKEEIETPTIKNGEIVADPNKDILKLCVFERYTGSGRVGIGFVKGFGLKRGAIASSVAHDNHNIVAIGTNDEDILFAVEKLSEKKGGKIVVDKGKVIEFLELPIAGLMSNKNVKYVAQKIEKLNLATKSLGCNLKDAFMVMSFLALPVIPEARVTDMGYINVNNFRVEEIFQ